MQNPNDPFSIKKRMKGSLMMLPLLIVLGVIIYIAENWEAILAYLGFER